MPLLNDDAMVEKAEQRASFRLTNVSSKLSRSEAERLDLLARKCGQQRGEFIRHLILDELTRDSGAPTASPELSGAGARVGPLGGVDLSSGVGVGGRAIAFQNMARRRVRNASSHAARLNFPRREPLDPSFWNALRTICLSTARLCGPWPSRVLS